jgi:hypothetical protein
LICANVYLNLRNQAAGKLTFMCGSLGSMKGHSVTDFTPPKAAIGWSADVRHNSVTMTLFERRNIALDISDEVLRLFPEVSKVSSEGDQELSYVFISNLVDYLEAQADPTLSSELIQRVQEFAEWAKRQPRGKDAKNDVLTVFTVGFIEKLFESERLYRLIPKLLSKGELTNSKPYLVQWVGNENFDRALALY